MIMNQIVIDVLTEMYAQAEPPIDFQEILDNPAEHDEFYLQHSLDGETQNAIVDKHAEKHGLTEREHSALYWTCVLDYGPTEGEVDADSS